MTLSIDDEGGWKMKRNPIENPVEYYSSGTLITPPIILPKDAIIRSNDCMVKFDKKFWSPDNDESLRVKEFEKKFSDRIQESECIEVLFEEAFHDETYEYNKEDSNWYLVLQGDGYA